MDGFKVPHSIPQDLLLIQEYIGVPPPLSVPKKVETDADVDDDDISSSDEDSGESDIANEEEIAADLVAGAVTDEDDLTMKK
jgi:H/ACA ribonucleoprotein complex non-core subunit NAF1